MASPARAGVAAAEVRATLLDGVRRRTGLDAAQLTQAGAWARALRLEGVTDETARDAESLLDALDGAAFGGAAAGSTALAERAVKLLAHIDAEARRARSPRMRQPAAVHAGVIALLMVESALMAPMRLLCFR